MSNLGFALDAAWKVLTVGLLLGAGLPALFAVGIRSLAWGTAHETTGDVQTHPAGRVIAYLCFALVAVAIACGILVVVSSGLGKAVDFSHGFPILVDKGH
ncbi:hypothetical protein [Falsarthrobacter nasiphocae]|uniref:Transmembrane protein n=1 Tax=Falsarthrobacter nasiphocae TaxID=189863 RepID=A0AAE3YDT9_9MICC|nr:hypothetical protein [Falsarthrobacter nasiphocae]MDR6892023.1 hypothetical protein [Falsarthrobacter nasiphocae]